MRYADTLLAQGERVVVRARQHWLALLIEARVGVALIALGAVLLVVVAAGPAQGTGVRNVLSIAAFASLLVGLLFLVWNAWQWWSQDYLITNRRILKVEGIINKRSSDSSLEKINDAVLHQDIWGRIFGYGDLDILTAAEGAIDRYRMLHQAPGFKREMLNQKHALEMEYAYRQPPSPPLRAGPHAGRDQRFPEGARPTPDGSYAEIGGARPYDPSAGREHALEPYGRQASPGAADEAPGSAADAAPAPHAAPAHGSAQHAPPPQAPVPSSPDADPVEITQTLARLADLRDRGAISPEEYEAKKDELLARL